MADPTNDKTKKITDDLVTAMAGNPNVFSFFIQQYDSEADMKKEPIPLDCDYEIASRLVFANFSNWMFGNFSKIIVNPNSPLNGMTITLHSQICVTNKLRIYLIIDRRIGNTEKSYLQTSIDYLKNLFY